MTRAAHRERPEQPKKALAGQGLSFIGQTE